MLIKEWRKGVVAKQWGRVILPWFLTSPKAELHWDIIMIFHWSFVSEISTFENCNDAVATTDKLCCDIILMFWQLLTVYKVCRFSSTEMLWRIPHVTNVEMANHLPVALSLWCLHHEHQQYWANLLRFELWKVKRNWEYYMHIEVARL